jgi:hypothetical protein
VLSSSSRGCRTAVGVCRVRFLLREDRRDRRLATPDWYKKDKTCGGAVAQRTAPPAAARGGGATCIARPPRSISTLHLRHTSCPHLRQWQRCARSAENSDAQIAQSPARSRGGSTGAGTPGASSPPAQSSARRIARSHRALSSALAATTEKLLLLVNTSHL